jgi:hypothetical protein
MTTTWTRTTWTRDDDLDDDLDEEDAEDDPEAVMDNLLTGSAAEAHCRN